MYMEFKIEKATSKEQIVNLLRIQDQVRFETYREFIDLLALEDVQYTESYEERAEIIFNRMGNNEIVMFYININNEVAGYIKVIIKESKVVIQDLIIKAQYQGQGLGTSLVNTVFEIFSENDKIFNYTVKVLKNNSKAIQFYTKLGFALDLGREFNYKIGSKKRAKTVMMFKLNKNVHLKYLQSARLMLGSLVKRNIPIVEIDPYSNSFIASINGNYIYFHGILTPLNTLSASYLANDKLMTKKALKLFKIPTPEYLCFSLKNLPEIEVIRKKLEEFLKIYPRIIAKPQNGLKSKDVFLNITNIDEAMGAYEHIMAKEYKGVLFEKYVPGDVHRLLLVDGKLVAALRREKGYLIADGTNTIRKLITEKNDYLNHGGRNVGRVIVDERLNKVLKEQGYNSLDDIPLKDAKIFTEIDFSNLETVKEVTNEVNKDLVASLGEFANRIGLGLTGMDVISEDISDITKSEVIEINKEPSIDFHHYPDYGSPVDVSGAIVDAIIRKYS